MLKNILRIFIAVIFLVSGFVKAVDVVGFSFKMEEYFSPAVFNLPLFEQWALVFSIVVVLLELILGSMLLLKIKLKHTLIALIALCTFFAFLTFYSAFYEVVTDCGCFGDAIKFTPWQSFAKDIVLLLLLLITFQLYRYQIHANNSSRAANAVLTLMILAFLFIIFFGIKHEPLIDFRDYKIGTNLNTEKEKIAADPSEFKTFYSLENKKTGEILSVNQDDYISKNYWKNPDWQILSDKTTSKLTRQGYASEISKFKIEDPSGADITENILAAPQAILIFSYNPDKMEKNNLNLVLQKMKHEPHTLILGVSTKANTFKNIPNALMDGTAIKTIARSNPFILTLQHGKIIAKSSAEDFLNP